MSVREHDASARARAQHRPARTHRRATAKTMDSVASSDPAVHRVAADRRISGVTDMLRINIHFSSASSSRTPVVAWPTCQTSARSTNGQTPCLVPCERASLRRRTVGVVAAANESECRVAFILVGARDHRRSPAAAQASPAGRPPTATSAGTTTRVRPTALTATITATTTRVRSARPSPCQYQQITLAVSLIRVARRHTLCRALRNRGVGSA